MGNTARHLVKVSTFTHTPPSPRHRVGDSASPEAREGNLHLTSVLSGAGMRPCLPAGRPPPSPGTPPARRWRRGAAPVPPPRPQPGAGSGPRAHSPGAPPTGVRPITSGTVAPSPGTLAPPRLARRLPLPGAANRPHSPPAAVHRPRPGRRPPR